MTELKPGFMMNATSIKAILAGTKTLTTRTIDLGEYEDVKDAQVGFIMDGELAIRGIFPSGEFGTSFLKPLRYQQGDFRFFKETWADTNSENGPMISYKAGGERFLVDESYPVDYTLYPGGVFSMWCGDLYRGEEGHFWRSSLHMPRWAARLFYVIEDIRILRLGEMSEQDYIDEGIPTTTAEHTFQKCYRDPDERKAERLSRWIAHWNSINVKKHPYDPKTWVSQVRFRLVGKDGGIQPTTEECYEDRLS